MNDDHGSLKPEPLLQLSERVHVVNQLVYMNFVTPVISCGYTTEGGADVFFT